MPAWLWIALGSGLGGAARYAIDVAGRGLTAATWPWPTLLVNVVGCLLIGWLATRLAQPGRHRHHPEVVQIPASLRDFLMTGFCGGFTTFSMLSLETTALLAARPLHGVVYLLVTLAGSVGAVAVGAHLGRARS